MSHKQNTSDHKNRMITCSDALIVLASAFSIPQSDTRTIEFSIVDFPSLRTLNFWKDLACLIFKSLLLPFLTFVNYEGPSLSEGFLRNLCPCFDSLRN